MPIAEQVKRQLLLTAALKERQGERLRSVWRESKRIICDYVLRSELKQNQVSAFTRLVLREQDERAVSEFLDKQAERREAWKNVAPPIQQYVCTELKREAEQIARRVQTRLGQPVPVDQQPSTDLVKQAWRLLAGEFASRFDGWYRILNNKQESERQKLCEEEIW